MGGRAFPDHQAVCVGDGGEEEVELRRTTQRSMLAHYMV